MSVAEPIAIEGERPIDVCKRLCRSPKVILDCGAGRGHFAGLFRAFYPNARILSCEPTSQRFDELQRNVGAFKVECRKFAVADRCGEASINITTGDESSSLLPSPPADHPLGTVHATVGTEQVQVQTIDSWVTAEGIDPADVSILKLDLQGAELLALRGAADVLKHVNIVVAEVWNNPSYEGCPHASEVVAELAVHGFEPVSLFNHPTGIWSDVVFRRKAADVRLNIGAGDTVIAGFTAIDRKFGTEAYPLDYPDNSVVEIRCSHMLEHLSFEEAQEAFREWNRVLKPGGRLRISVPDVRKVVSRIDHDENWRFHLMGGQTNGDDFHKSVYDDELLRAHFDAFGFQGVQPWHSPNTDSAALACSLNLEGFKAAPREVRQKIKGIMSLPRVGWNDAWHSIASALRPLSIPVETFNGVFWGQCMQRAFEQALAEEIDWILCIDYDSMITAEHVAALLRIASDNPHIDALAPLQARRGHESAPLMTIAGTTQLEVTGEPIKVATAHFGLTLVRAAALRDVAKPWFKSEPDANGEWSDDKFDDDIWFWHQWRKAGKNIYVAPDVRIGHLQLMVSEFDDDMQPRHVHVNEWRKAQKQ